MLPARVAFLLLVLEAALQAGGPLLIKDGVPRRWATSAPIVLDLDPGPLGGIPSDVANSIVQFAIGQWNGVTTSQLRLAIGAPLSKDIESLTKLQFDNFTTKDDGTNDLLMSDVLRTNELQVWFIAEHLVDVPVVRV